MRRRRRPSAFAFVLLLALPFAVAFDPCDNFDLSACDPAAECWSDQRLVAACRCQAGFADLSPNITHAPGRKCVKVPVATRAGAECSPGDPFSCDQQKAEVCVFLDGRYKCDCPSGYGRLADGRCMGINECTNQPKMHTCAPEAECVDKDVGYECKCPSNLIDVSPYVHRRGRKCAQKVDECKDPERFGVECHENARCVDTAESFECRCLPGFLDVSVKSAKMPGRLCVESRDDCAEGDHDCSPDAECENLDEGYTCQCLQGFVDASPDVKRAPGRVCNRPTNSSAPPPSFPLMDHDLCDPNSARACRPNEICSDRDHPGTFTCVCASNAFRFRDGACRLQAACDTQRECDPNAICTNVFDSFECKCKEGYADVSDDEGALGRRCKKLINECAEKTHNCDSNAQCVDTEREFTCKCFSGFLDASARYGLPPGRVCSTASNECASPSLNSCDENADCINRPDGYTCSCIAGFIDVSSSANLPPGRVCTLQTTCPTQKTDLMFLIDGSGSIGADVFKQEILRFVREFIDLFDLGTDKTRVGLIQFSDHIRHELDLGEFESKAEIKQAIERTEYLTGLTRTGAAIKHMAVEGFSERRGARPLSANVSRVAIVITDGRSQDNVTQAALDARCFSQINLFAIGVTDHVLSSELELIVGEPNRWFLVQSFKDLDTRLRASIQKIACPLPTQTANAAGRCEVATQTGCNRELNEICVLQNGRSRCVCPPGFERHPLTNACGSPDCNPEVSTACPSTEICARTPFGRHRCVCRPGYRREKTGGVCIAENIPAYAKSCATGQVLNPRTGVCQQAGTCDPNDAEACDSRKREKCLRHPDGRQYTCRCEGNVPRHPVLDICLSNECMNGEHDCDPSATCVDTDESFLCSCPTGFVDQSPNPVEKPGRKCGQVENECTNGQNDCSVNSACIDLFDGFNCRCKAGFVDFSPDVRKPGRVCRQPMDECASSELNDCGANSMCKDTRDSFTCTCLAGFADIDELRHPGRVCLKGAINECKSPMLNRCSKNAVCLDEPEGYRCECKDNFVDRSPAGSFGFICEPPEHPCDNSERNDCSKPDGTCIRLGEDFSCSCINGSIDRSPDPKKPGRVCVQESPCVDPNRNDCHPKAICSAVNGSSSEFACRCRDGYRDDSPSPARPGRICIELINECLDRSLNDCDPLGVCEDLADGYTCRCPLTSIDQSPDQNRLGRRCLPQIDECANERLNNCSRFADCHDKEVGFECQCKAGYHDENPQSPGTNCTYVIDECENPALNACHRHAECTDLPGGYSCKCKPPYADAMPEQPGRICLFDECSNSTMNTCSPHATCKDTADGYTCTCREGFYDDAKDAAETGRTCLPLTEEKAASQLPLSAPKIDGIPCGRQFCAVALNEVCAEGFHCECRPGEARGDPKNKCEQVNRIPLSVRVVDRNGQFLRYSSQFGNPTNVPYIEFSALFAKEMGELLKSIDFAPNSWSEGLLVNYTVAVKPPTSADEKCELWEKFLQATAAIDHRLAADGQLRMANDVELLGPCPAPPNYCAGVLCNSEVGEVCVDGRCQVDFCVDVNFCAANTTCKNQKAAAFCECKEGFMDIRESTRRVAAGLPSDALCLRKTDVNECALGLHTCSVLASCTDKRDGFACSCPSGYVDGNPAEPGRVCAALLCDLCNQHGDCIPDGTSVKCACTEGWTGEHCDVAPSDVPLILLILLALLFLLLTICCLLFAASKTRCFRRVAPWSSLDQSGGSSGASNNSELYTLAIPRAKLHPNVLPDLADRRSAGSADSDFTTNEEVERRVISEVTFTEYNGDDGAASGYHAFGYEPHDEQRGVYADRRTSFLDYPPHPLDDHDGRLSAAFVDHPRSLRGEQDDRSIESYATTAQRVYERR